MEQTGASSGLLSLYNYYADVCLAPAAAEAGTGRSLPQSFIAKYRSTTSVDACSEQHTEEYLNTEAVRRALHVDMEAAR